MQLPEFLTLNDLIHAGIFKNADAYYNLKYQGKSVPEPISKDVAGNKQLYFSRQTVQEWLRAQTGKTNLAQQSIAYVPKRIKKNVTIIFTPQELDMFMHVSKISNQMQLIKDALTLYYEHNKDKISALPS